MKHLFGKIALWLLTLIVLAPLSIAVAQTVNQTNDNQQKTRARDLYIEHQNNQSQGSPGARVRILLNRDGQERYVTTNQTFYSGDRIRLVFNTNFAGHVALLNLGSSGRINLLYPYKGASSMVVANGNRETQIPSRDWIRFDERAGVERISIIFSKNPIQSVEQVIALSNQNSGAATAVATAQSAAVTNATPGQNAAAANATVAQNSGGETTVNNGTVVNNTTNNTVNNTTINNTNVNINAGSEIYVATSAEAQAILQELNSRSLKRGNSRDLFIETANNDATYVVANTDLIGEPTAFVISLRHERR